MRANNRICAPLPGALAGGDSQKIYYVLAETPCPYLPGRWERKLLTEIRGEGASSYYSLLSRAGFRRSHHYAYRPACEGCNSCVPVRVVARDFVASRSLRRIARKNADLHAEVCPAVASQEQFRVFKRYIDSRHDDGEMASMSFDDYRSMVEQSELETQMVEFRDHEQNLIAACLLDWLDDGPSAVYSFFDPKDCRRSPGIYMVLWLIEAARSRQRQNVYLGYWIRETGKMAYKSRFQPLEALGPRGWQRLAP
jgi:arginine-tRNA-protein transferase